MAKKPGRPKVADPLETAVLTRLNAELSARLEAYAVKHERSASWIARKAIEEFLDREEGNASKGGKGEGAGGK
jgi:predicted transcriptional regulator